MSMGKLGAVSRFTGSVFGSALTFGTVGKSSAPGQIPAVKLKELLSFLE
jgi:3-dehydroquinate dehydratase-1